MKWLAWYADRDVRWFRVLGYGLWLGRTPPLFSERIGYVRRLRLWGGWRLGWLGRTQ